MAGFLKVSNSSNVFRKNSTTFQKIKIFFMSITEIEAWLNASSPLFPWAFFHLDALDANTIMSDANLGNCEAKEITACL